MARTQTPETIPEWSLRRGPLSAPIMINLELTTACNLKCRHCYNFWREDPASFRETLHRDQIDRAIDEIVKSGVYHVVLTGGEPMVNFKVLLHALHRFKDAGISTSMNSNLTLTSAERTRKLTEAGLDHVLTSVFSYDRETNDSMMNEPGTLAQVIEGIETTREGGIRVSVNMVVSRANSDHVYETGRLCARLDVQKLFATRLVPAVTASDLTETDLDLQQKQARKAVEDLMRVKRDFGIGVGSLISYPLCFLGDLERYKDLVGRGCPAQSGNRMVMNADGSVHACTHEESPYGNVFREGIRPLFAKMMKWHDGSLRYEGCAGCPYQMVCASGCRMAAHAYFGNTGERDPLFVGHEKITRHFAVEIPAEAIAAVDAGAVVAVPKRVRFREEPGYFTINVRWANAFAIPRELALFLRGKRDQSAEFDVEEMEGVGGRDHLLYLVYKDAVEFADPAIQRVLADRPGLGCSVNPFDLPPGPIRAV
jgi:radical SAM protein with 4Fe4S-binding SPASM domain